MNIVNHIDFLLDFISNKENLVIAEVGVHKGKLCDNLLCHHSDKIKEYWAVDQWVKFDDKKYGRYATWSQESWDLKYIYVCSLMFKYNKLRVVRLPSIQAAKLFPLLYFDLVYLDADHFYESVKQDIECWMPLVREGGWISGHDYGRRESGKGVKPAVDELFNHDKVSLYVDGVWMVQK
jgi:hypothetical protein